MRRTSALIALLLLAGAPAAAEAAKKRDARTGADDAVVVAVIDSGFNPYHWDFSAAKMPQAVNDDPADDLPLDRPASEWLRGVPRDLGLQRLDLTLDDENKATTMASLKAKDTESIAEIEPSTGAQPHLYWIPGTKVIGAATTASSNKLATTQTAHGAGTSSSAVGALHGTCPECLVVLLQYHDAPGAERLIDWAMKQGWIDVVTNSYGFSLVSRDRIYSKSNTALQKEASERGQTIFFSAGNGQENAYTVPNPTLFSSQEGPDWIVTVGAVSPGADNYYGPLPGQAAHGTYMGAGKPADIAGIGQDYPTAYGSAAVGGTGASGFSGTSNATPQVAGTYARGLYKARRELSGPSRVQEDGVIASGSFRCGALRLDCELGDGELTVDELRTRLFHGAVHSDAGLTTGLGLGELPRVGEEEFLGEGHGHYAGRESVKRNAWLSEFARFFDPLTGGAETLARPAGEREWFVVDSFCRQRNWGTWGGGYYLAGRTALPADDPGSPLRTTLKNSCPGGRTPLNRRR